MSIRFSCSSCQAGLRANPSLLGKRFKCPKCGNVARIQAIETPTAPSHAEEGRNPRPELANVGAVATPTKPRARTAHPPTPPDLPHSPVAPKFAQLDPREQHLYTFTIQPVSTTGISGAPLRRRESPPVGNRITPASSSTSRINKSWSNRTTSAVKRKARVRGLLRPGEVCREKDGPPGPMGLAYNQIMKEEGELMEEMLNKPPEWFAIEYWKSRRWCGKTSITPSRTSRGNSSELPW